MSKKKILTFIIVTIVVGTLIFIIIDKTVDKKLKNKNSNSNNSNITSNISSNVVNKETEIINLKTYQELRTIHDDEVFAIIIMKSDDEVCNTFKEEVLKSFNTRKSKVYELDIDKLDKNDLSLVISDVSKIQKYKEPTLITPTLLVSKKGKIVYVREGLMYSSELSKNLDENEIE